MNQLLYLLRALLSTVEISVATICLATLFGVAAGLIAVMGDSLTRGLVTAYVFVVRGVPLLVQIFLVYFGLPFFGIRANPYAVAILAISAYTGAQIAEIVRGAIKSLPRGQSEAGVALGMTDWQVMKLVILPQALRSAFPPFISMLPVTVKNTAFASVISIWELTLAAKEVTSLTLNPFAIYGVSFAMYLLLCYPLTVLSTRLETRLTSYKV